MRWKQHLSLAVAVASTVTAIFSDEAFDIDYHQSLLGFPQPHTTFFHKPQKSSNASLLYTISDKAVLGAVNPKDGSVLWRHALADQPSLQSYESFLVGGEGDGRTISGHGSVVSSWDALDGRLVWEHLLGPHHIVKGLETVPQISRSVGTVRQDIIVLSAPTQQGTAATVLRINGDDHSIVWQYQDSSANHDTSISIAVSSSHVFYTTKSSGILSSGKAKVIAFDIATGKEINSHSVAADAEGLGKAGTHASGSCQGVPFLVSTEKPYKSIKVHVLESQKSSNIVLEEKSEDIEELEVHHACGLDAPPHFLVHARTRTRHWAEIYHIHKETGDVEKAYSLPATAESSTFAASSADNSVYFIRLTDTEVLLYSSQSHGQLGRWPRSSATPGRSGGALQAVAEVSARGSSGLALRIAASDLANSWSLIRNGETQWTRPEVLAYITKAVWANDIESESLIHEIQIEATSNPLTAYILRLTRHVNSLKHLPLHLINLPSAIMSSGDGNAISTREKLVGGKLVLVATSRRELLAIDAAHKGTLRWRLDLSEKISAGASVIHLSVDSSILTAYFTDGSIAAVSIVNGELKELKKASKPFEKIVELPSSPASTIVRVGSDGIPEVFSEFAPSVPTEGNIVMTINNKGEAVGWTIGSTIDKTWVVRPPPGAKIVEAVSRPAHDPVASIGRVLGDRSVLYKYMSPNLALLTALSSSALTIYVVNAVTGIVLHSSTHEGIIADLPTSAVISENWFAYSFTNRDPVTLSLSTQIIISELYESATPNERSSSSSTGNYSSYSPDANAKPYVISQAYTAAEPISNFAVSETGQGITTRSLLATLANSNSIIAIPREILSARRPVDRDPTAAEAEEGLFRYSPILELDPKLYISHSRDVMGVQRLLATPTLLESTSMIFAYGHDIFGTQLSPSNSFDVLGKDFKRVQLLLTVVALYFGVIALRPVVRKTMVNRRWQ